MNAEEKRLQLLLADQRLCRLHSYLRSEAIYELSLADAARLVCLEEHYFSTYFRARVGITFREWKQEIRIEHAKKMLADSTLPISQISAQVGYHDPTSFIRFFRRRIGLTPSSFRASYQLSRCRTEKP